ncbi:MAG: CDP-glycerol glycerophosphotransferase family protein [Anaerolineae bacterium]|nr:CDP-glycerol glycerophosphotransferase family protein [Anaerolineae bacterium]
MGDAVASWLAGQGVPAERITVTGQPRYDALHAMRQATAPDEGPDAPNLPEGERIVLFCSQPYLRYNVCGEAEARSIWRTVADGVRGLGAGHHLVAKLHPAEDLQQTRRWLGDDFSPEWTMTRDADVMSLLWRADVLVTLISSTALEAIALGKPVVLLDLGIMPEPIPYSETGAALRAQSAQELTRRLREVLQDGDARQRLARAREAFLPAYAGPLDGKAALRVAREIHALAVGDA